MRIYIIDYWHNKRFRNKKGGPIKVIELADNLRELGHDVLLFLPKLGFPKRQTVTNIQQIPIVDEPVIRPLLYGVMNLLSILICAVRRKPDIIYIRYMLNFLPALFARLWGIPCIIEVNDEIHSSSSIIAKITLFFDWVNFTCATKIITLTKGLKRNIISVNNVAAEKIELSSSGTNTNIFFPRKKKECRKLVGLDGSENVIGFAGTFMFNYGIDVLIDASPIIVRKIPNTKFLIVGDGQAMESWKGKIRELSMESYYILPGNVSREEAAIFIGAMDVCVAPYHSTRGETSPVKLYDYFACARPVVASAIGAIVAVKDEFPGLTLVNPNDPNALARSLLDILEHQESYDNAAMRSKEIIFEKYSWRNVAEQVVDVSRSII